MSVKLKTSVALVGLPGVGKSAIAEALNRRTGIPFCDIDSRIVAQHGQSIPHIFAQQGEAAFRRFEYDAIAAALRTTPPLLLALGGGAFAETATRALLQSASLTVWLKASLEDVLQRLKSAPDTRPLLATADPRDALYRLARARAPFYATADHQLDLTGIGIDDAAARLYRLLLDHDVLVP